MRQLLHPAARALVHTPSRQTHPVRTVKTYLYDLPPRVPPRWWGSCHKPARTLLLQSHTGEGTSSKLLLKTVHPPTSFATTLVRLLSPISMHTAHAPKQPLQTLAIKQVAHPPTWCATAKLVRLLSPVSMHAAQAAKHTLVN